VRPAHGAGAASGALLWGTLSDRDRVLEAIKAFNPTVIQTNLSHDNEEALVRAL
jgi:hypothetical protein